MHERYFYMADVLSIVVAFYRPRLWLVPVLVQFASFFSYLPFLFGRRGAETTVIGFPVLAAAMLVALILVVWDYLKVQLDGRRHQEQQRPAGQLPEKSAGPSLRPSTRASRTGDGA
jgi:uncharacterized membrane protein